jgi:hypothetical protein
VLNFAKKKIKASGILYALFSRRDLMREMLIEKLEELKRQH